MLFWIETCLGRSSTLYEYVKRKSGGSRRRRLGEIHAEDGQWGFGDWTSTGPRDGRRHISRVALTVAGATPAASAGNGVPPPASSVK